MNVPIKNKHTNNIFSVYVLPKGAQIIYIQRVINI